MRKESEIPMEDLLESLPQNMLRRITGEAHSDGSEDDEDDSDSGTDINQSESDNEKEER